jgi:hypothetical protein
MSATVDPEAVMDALIDGASLAEAARRFSLPEREVKAILEEATKHYCDATAIRERWMLAERRMEAIELQFYRLAKETDDHIAAGIAVKANERRSTLSGANSPIGYVVQLTNAAPLVQESSTEYFERTLDRLMGKPEPPAAQDDKPN